MLGTRGDHMPTTEEGDGALERKIVRLGGTRGEDDLFRLGTNGSRHLRPRCIHGAGGFGPGFVVRGRIGVHPARFEIRAHGLPHRLRQRRGGGVVEIQAHARLDRHGRHRGAGDAADGGEQLVHLRLGIVRTEADPNGGLRNVALQAHAHQHMARLTVLAVAGRA